MALATRNNETDTAAPTTTAARRDPFAELQRWVNQFTRVPDSWSEMAGGIDGFVPVADVEETDDAYLLELELPGIKKSDIDISIVGRRLTVSGERKEREREGILRRRTRSMGRFQLDVVLPGEVNEDGVSASLDAGVLTIRVPKADAEQPRHIKVS